MAGVRVEWAKFGRVDSFSVYRSDSPIDFSNLPPALATGLTQCEYWDATALRGKTYFYTVSAQTGLDIAYSDKSIPVFTSNNDFIFPMIEGYAPPLSPNVNFIW